MLFPVSPRRTRARRLDPRSAVAASGAAITIGAVLLVPAVAAGAAQAPVGLGTANSFAVLAGSGITNTGTTTITGDVGTFPTTSMTGTGSMTITGTNYAGGPVTQQAKTDLRTAYNEAAGALNPTAVATELGGRTLTPGVYSNTTLAVTGTLTLDTLGDPNAVFVFQAGSTLITAVNSRVIVLGGALACNVFWQVGSSATLGTASTLVGTVMAETSITATTGAAVQGRLLALGGAVTMDTNTISNAGCATGGGSTTTTTTGSGTTTTTGATGGTTTTAPGSTPTVPGSLAGPPTPDTPGLTTTTTPTTRQRPPLPNTGPNPWWTLAGTLSLMAGFVLLSLSRRINPIR